MLKLFVSLLCSAVMVSICPAMDFDSPIVGHWSRTTSNGAEGLVIAGNYAYLADAQRGIQVIDVSDPTNPLWVAGLPTVDYAMNVVWSADHLYVADRNGGLVIIDVANPRTPQRVGVLAITNCFDLDVSGDYAYVSRGAVGLAIVDVRQRSAPVLAAEVNVPGAARGVAATATRAYVCFFAGFITVDVTIPNQPRVLSTNEGGFSVRLHGNILYTGRSAWDVSNPEAPKAISNPPEADDHFYVSGGYFGVLHGEAGIEFFDISNPTNAFRMGYFSGQWPAVYVSNGYAYLIDRWVGGGRPDYAPRDTGLYVARLKVPANPQRQGVRSVGSRWLSQVVVSGDYAYCAVNLGEPRIYDVRDPAVPRFVRSLDAVPAWQLATAGPRLYCVERHINILDISSPTSPTLIGTYAPDYWINDLATGPSNVLYVASSRGLLILDATDPKSVKTVFESSGSSYTLDLSGNRLCVDLEYPANGFKVLDVSDPYHGQLLGIFTHSSGVGLVGLAGDFVYFIDGEAHLNLVDVSEPASPRLTASVAIGDWRVGAIVADERYIYLATYGGVQVFDAKDPRNPYYVGGNSMFSCEGLAELNTSICAVGNTFAVLDKFHPLNVSIGDVDLDRQQHELSISAPPRQTVTLQSSSNLVDWIELESIAITNPPASMTITNRGRLHEFYRVVWP